MTTEIEVAPDDEDTFAGGSGTWNIVPSGTTDTVLADTSDSSYVEADLAGGHYLRFPAPTLPAGSVIEYLRVAARCSRSGNNELAEVRIYYDLAAGAVDFDLRALQAHAVLGPTISDDDIGTLTDQSTPISAGSDTWTLWDSAADRAKFAVGLVAKPHPGTVDDSSLWKCTKLRLVFGVNTPPTVSGITPTGAGQPVRPLIKWTYDDDDGDPQQFYRVKVFSSEQYGAGGFDPNTEYPVGGGVGRVRYDSGKVASSIPRHQVADYLDGDLTFKTYIRVWQPSLNGHDLHSAWTASATFTVDSPLPTPALTVTRDNTNARFTIGIDAGGDDSAATDRSFVILRYVTVLGDLVPAAVRGAYPVDYSGTPLTLHDYEVPAGVTVKYVAKELGTISGDVVASSSTAPTSDGALPYVWWLKDPLAPALNTRVTVIEPVSYTRRRPGDVAYPTGSDRASVSHEGTRGIEGDLHIRCLDHASRLRVAALLEGDRTLLLQNVFGEQFYVAALDASYELIVARKVTGEAYPIRDLHEWTVRIVEVPEP